MPNERVPEAPSPDESNESFDQLLSVYEQSHARKGEQGDRRLEGTVIAVTSEAVLFDIGFKTEGLLPLASLAPGEGLQPGDKLAVTIKGRDPEGYYELVRGKIQRPTDWPALEQAFAGKATILGTVTGVVKGGLNVDVGVRAFLPASRSGTRDAAEMEKLVGQEIRCRITKLDVTDEDVVVDRRAVIEEEQQAIKERRYSEIKEGDTVSGTVRSLTDYGAFVDIGGVDALLHVSDIAWSRISKPADVLSVGQSVETRVLKISDDPAKRRVSVGMKQLQPHPWDAAAEKYKTGERVRGVVTRVAEFGAFVQLAEGVEGMIHVSEISADKHIHHPQDVLRLGQSVKAQVLAIDQAKRQMRLSMKQLVPTGLDEYLAEHKPGDLVTGRMAEISSGEARVELGQGVYATCRLSGGGGQGSRGSEPVPAAKADLSSLSSMLQARWKSGSSLSNTK